MKYKVAVVDNDELYLGRMCRLFGEKYADKLTICLLYTSKITYDKNNKSYSIIVENPKKDAAENVCFTVVYAGNDIYREWKQTYKLALTRKKAKITYTAVSYTHLDVYKRQEQSS